MKITARLLCSAVLFLAAAQVAFAAGPLYVGGPNDAPGKPYVWNNQFPVSYWTDRSGLGVLNKSQADQFTADCFAIWHNVPTANISFSRSGDLSVDVNASNILTLIDNPNSEINTRTSIVYDIDGTLTDALYGAGASNVILGFAGITQGGTDGIHNYFQSGLAVLNGKFINGAANPEISQQKFKEVFVHEFGHLIGLDHSQFNIEVLNGSYYWDTDRLAGLPTMFPFLLDTPARPAPATDDVAAVSRLYPTASFATTFGTISGHILFSDQVSPVQGLNVVVRQVDDPATASVDESKRVGVTGVSGFLFTGSSGNSLTADPGSRFGSRDQSLIGYFEIPGIPPGTYTLSVEPINPDFVLGSGVGPIGEMGFQLPIPGNCNNEFWNTSESSSDDCSTSSTLTITPGLLLGPNTDIILNGTPPTYDPWEGTALRMPPMFSVHSGEEVLA